MHVKKYALKPFSQNICAHASHHLHVHKHHYSTELENIFHYLYCITLKKKKTLLTVPAVAWECQIKLCLLSLRNQCWC